MVAHTLGTSAAVAVGTPDVAFRVQFAEAASGTSLGCGAAPSSTTRPGKASILGQNHETMLRALMSHVDDES